MVTVAVLSENSVSYAGSRTCRAEWGLSLLVDFHGFRMLLDTGASALFRENGKATGSDPDSVDAVVLSHHHWDHTGGIDQHAFRKGTPLYLHPDLLPKLSPERAALCRRDFSLHATTSPIEIVPGLWFLGEIPRETGFEEGVYKDDPMRDDSALACALDDGVMVITGCSHAGIVNICRHAERVTGKKFAGAMGGFHLSAENERAVAGTIGYFRERDARLIYPLHCVDFPVMCRLERDCGAVRYGTGNVVELS